MIKLVVEVQEASDLMAKDGQGSANPCVEVNFDDQRQRNQTKHKDLNPKWNDKFVFNAQDIFQNLLLCPSNYKYLTCMIYRTNIYA